MRGGEKRIVELTTRFSTFKHERLIYGLLLGIPKTADPIPNSNPGSTKHTCSAVLCKLVMGVASRLTGKDGERACDAAGYRELPALSASVVRLRDAVYAGSRRGLRHLHPYLVRLHLHDIDM